MSLTITSRPGAPLVPADLHALDALDAALRRQAVLLARVVRGLDPHDQRATREAQDWFDRFGQILDHRHRTLRGVLLPALVEVDPASAALVAAVRTGLDRTADRTDRVAGGLAALVGLADLGATAALAHQHQATVDAIDDLVIELTAALDREEATLRPNLLRHLPRANFDELREEIVLQAGATLLPFLFPVLVDVAAPGVEARLVAQLPRMLRIVHRHVWVPSHRTTYPTFAAASASIEPTHHAA